MSLGWVIYLAGLTDSLNIALIILLIIICTSLVFSLVLIAPYKAADMIPYKKYYISAGKYLLGILALLSFLPSSSTVYLILGVNIAEYTVNNIYNSEVYNDVVDILSIKLKDIKEDLIAEEQAK